MGRPIGWGAAAVLDFLIEDVCVLCGRSGSSAPLGEPADPAECLLEPVMQPLPLRAGHITNHPVCEKCAANFDRARNVGLLGWRRAGGVVETTRGDQFRVPAGISEARGAAAVPDPFDAADAHAGRALEPISLVSPFMTNDNVLQLIHLLKFSRYRALAGPIARTMGAAVRSLDPALRDATAIVPTPMNPRDLRHRGFNQAREIALELANDLEMPILTGVLRKTARTAPQSRTTHQNRAHNVRHAFACSGAEVRDGHVLLVDDLVTTGATAAACAAVVLAAGACRVTVLCFGRAV